MAFYALLCIACVLPATVLSFPAGAGSAACLDLTPQHGAVAQTSTSPYMLSVDTTSVRQGGMITVTLNATTAGDMFRGFLVQARCTKCTTGDTAIVPGTFAKFIATDDTIQTMDCENGAKNSMSHTSRADKASAKFTWKVPDNFNVAEGIQFRATVVQVQVTWWSGVTSAEIDVTASSTSQVAPVMTLALLSFVTASFLLQ